MSQLPMTKSLRPQASFLIWLDCHDLGLDHKQLDDLFVHQAHLALNDGEMFGPGSEGYMRFNVGCSRKLVAQAMQQLRDAVKRL